MSGLNKFLTGLLQHVRAFSTASNSYRIIGFKEVGPAIRSGEIVILDVREKDELVLDGKISSKGVNVPVGEISKAFNLDESEFERMYGSPKPKQDDSIVVHCKKGIRAELAAKRLSQLGYKQIKVYAGIEDWIQNGGKLLK